MSASSTSPILVPSYLIHKKRLILTGKNELLYEIIEGYEKIKSLN